MCVAGTQGYVYSSFLKAYNPQREQTRAQAEQTDDFDNLSLFVSGSGSSSLRSYSLHASDSTSTLSGLQGEPEGSEDNDTSEEQHVRLLQTISAKSDAFQIVITTCK